MQTNNPVNSSFSPPISLSERDKHLFDLDSYPFIDVPSCLKNMHVDSDSFFSILQTVITEFPNEKNAYLLAYKEGDWDKIEKLAHRMKGGAMYTGLVRLQYACQFFEEYYQQDQTQLLNELYQQIMHVIQETEKVLQSIMSDSMY